MKSSLVIASVFLAGVALGVNAYRINNNNQDENQNQWFRFQQTDFSGESLNVGAIPYDQKTDDSKIYNNNEQLNQHIMKNDDNSESTFDGRKNSQYDETYFGLNENFNQNQRQRQQQYGSQNQVSSGQSNELTKKIADKIVAIQQIFVNHNIADNVNYLNGALDVARNSIRLSDKHFVSFFNSTINSLDNGKLKYIYLNPEKDTVLAQYHFKQIKTVGSFNSDVRDARSGYYTIVMNNVYSNLSTGFYDDKHFVVRSARFQSADANVKIQDGSETQAFNPALQRFVEVLANAVSNKVKMSARNNAFVQIKNEILKPIVFQNTENNSLFDLTWQEGNVAMEMPNIGFQNSQLVSTTEQLLKSMTFQRKSQNSYIMYYDFDLDNLKWTSTLTVKLAGEKTIIPHTKFNIPKINIRVYVSMLSSDQQQSCDNISANVNVQGINYNLNYILRSEVVTTIDNNLEHFIQHYLESNIQTSLKQLVCNNNYNKY